MSEKKKSCENCIHYEICSLWSTTDLDEDKAYKYCYNHYKSREDNRLVSKKEFKIYQEIYDFMQEKDIVSVDEMKTLVNFALKSSMLKAHIVKGVINDILSTPIKLSYGLDAKTVNIMNATLIDKLEEVAKKHGVEIGENK